MKLYTWKICTECEGSGTVWKREAHYSTTCMCMSCLGLGELPYRLSKVEALKLIEQGLE